METLGRGVTSDFRERGRRQTQLHLGVALLYIPTRGWFQKEPGGEKKGRRGERERQQRETWLSTGCSFWNGRRVTLHRRQMFFFFLFLELRRAALFSWLCCYLDGKVAICQKSRGSLTTKPPALHN